VAQAVCHLEEVEGLQHLAAAEEHLNPPEVVVVAREGAQLHLVEELEEL
jgi:hypothetical protein